MSRHSGKSAANMLLRARVNLSEARMAGATDLDVFTALVQTMRGHAVPSPVDRDDAADLLAAYADLFHTPGQRPAPPDPGVILGAAATTDHIELGGRGD